MGIFSVSLILIGLFIFAIICMVAGVAIFVGIFWLALVLIQLALGALIKKATGKRPKWLMSKKTFTIEAVIALGVIFVIFLTPVKSGDLLPDGCSYISYSFSKDDGGSRAVYRSEQVEDILELLGNYKLKRRLNLEFLNESVIWHDDGGLFLYLRDEDGALLKKIRFYGDMFGISNKEDGKFVYYKAEGEINTYPYKTVIYQEGWENTLDSYRENLDALMASWSYDNGTFSFTIPEWGTDDWRFSIDGKVPIPDENGEKADTDYITYIEEDSETSDWKSGQTVYFTLTDAPHESLECTVKINGYSYVYSILKKADEKYIWQKK